MTPDEWLARNAFYCAPLRARITPAQCEINRTREQGRCEMDLRPPQCLVCDWERMQEAGGRITDTREEKVNRIKAGVKKRLELIKARKDAAKQKEEGMAKSKQVCLECKRKMYVVARGLCGKCYYGLQKTGELDTKYPAKKAGPQKTNRSEIDMQKDFESTPAYGNSPDVTSNSADSGPPVTECLTYDEGLGSQDPPPYGTAINPHPGNYDLDGCRHCRNTYELDKMSGPQLRLFFGSVPGGDELYKRIQSEAERELRSPEMQVMYVLSRALPAGVLEQQ